MKDNKYRSVKLTKDVYDLVISKAKYGETLSEVIKISFDGKYAKKVGKNDNK